MTTWMAGKPENAKYLQNILKAKNCIDSDLFRPPYGRITRSQHKGLLNHDNPFKVIMWSLLSGDFDLNITPEQCCEKVLKNAESGSVIVFHDSEKANEKLRYTFANSIEIFFRKGIFV